MMVYEICDEGLKLTDAIEEVKFPNIMTHLNLTIEGDIYKLLDEEKQALDEEKAKWTSKKGEKAVKRPSTSRQTQYMDDDSLCTVLVQPDHSISDRSMSGRIRKVRISTTSNQKN